MALASPTVSTHAVGRALVLQRGGVALCLLILTDTLFVVK